jgi:hypothetical protein
VAHVGPWPRVPSHVHAGTQRWRGHRPPPHTDAVDRPPRPLHTPRMWPPPRVPLSHSCRGPKGKHPLYLNSSSRQLTVLLPYRRLPSSRAHHGEPPAALRPKSGSSSTGLTPMSLSRRPTAAGQPDLAGEPPATREIFPSPVSSVTGRNAQGSWAAWPSRPGHAVG